MTLKRARPLKSEQNGRIDVERFRRAMREIVAKRGQFTLFAIFRREEAPGWDLVVSSTWLDEGKLKALGEFAEELKRLVGEQQLRELSRIVTIKQDDPDLKAILDSIQVDNGLVELREQMFFGRRVEHAIFLHAQRRARRMSNAEWVTKP